MSIDKLLGEREGWDHLQNEGDREEFAKHARRPRKRSNSAIVPLMANQKDLISETVRNFSFSFSDLPRLTYEDNEQLLDIQLFAEGLKNSALSLLKVSGLSQDLSPCSSTNQRSPDSTYSSNHSLPSSVISGIEESDNPSLARLHYQCETGTDKDETINIGNELIGHFDERLNGQYELDELDNCQPGQYSDLNHFQPHGGNEMKNQEVFQYHEPVNNQQYDELSDGSIGFQPIQDYELYPSNQIQSDDVFIPLIYQSHDLHQHQEYEPLYQNIDQHKEPISHMETRQPLGPSPCQPVNYTPLANISFLSNMVQNLSETEYPCEAVENQSVENVTYLDQPHYSHIPENQQYQTTQDGRLSVVSSLKRSSSTGISSPLSSIGRRRGKMIKSNSMDAYSNPRTNPNISLASSPLISQKKIRRFTSEPSNYFGPNSQCSSPLISSRRDTGAISLSVYKPAPPDQFTNFRGTNSLPLISRRVEETSFTEGNIRVLGTTEPIKPRVKVLARQPSLPMYLPHLNSLGQRATGPVSPISPAILPSTPTFLFDTPTAAHSQLLPTIEDQPSSLKHLPSFLLSESAEAKSPTTPQDRLSLMLSGGIPDAPITPYGILSALLPGGIPEKHDPDTGDIPEEASLVLQAFEHAPQTNPLCPGVINPPTRSRLSLPSEDPDQVIPKGGMFNFDRSNKTATGVLYNHIVSHHPALVTGLYTKHPIFNEPLPVLFENNVPEHVVDKKGCWDDDARICKQYCTKLLVILMLVFVFIIMFWKFILRTIAKWQGEDEFSEEPTIDEILAHRGSNFDDILK